MDSLPTILQSNHNRIPTAPTGSTSLPKQTVVNIPVSVSTLLERADLHTDMHCLEELLMTCATSTSTAITEAAIHTIQAGGKRLRGAQVLLAARLGTYDFSTAQHAAAAVELIHAASLVHDDLVDNTAQRRGRVTVHAAWDSDVALMTGDFLFAQAAAQMALCPDPRIVTTYAAAVQTIVTGELNPVTAPTPFAIALEQYTRKIAAKTAALFEAGCRAGAVVGGGNDAQVEALGNYGYDLGIAFQIVDDVLDFTGSADVLGKPAGNDLREGTITLPLIYAIDTTNSGFLREIAGQPDLSPAEVQQALRDVDHAGGSRRAMDDAFAYMHRAIMHLQAFPDQHARQALIDIAHFVITRQK